MAATSCKEYEFLTIEPHWQAIWEQTKPFRAENGSTKPKFYVLDMFPYPSGAGLHIGHPEGYTATDILARYKRARGFNVLHPIGWDAFGLPAEQHAVKTGTHPATNTQNNITNFRRQIKALGFSYDWDREVDTTDPKYFRWTQWIFLQLFKKGLAYVDERPVWWCPELRTVLANEEVVDGKSEVGGFPVERRNLRQWVLRITAYAEQLIDGLKDVDWPDSTKRMQEAWIGRSEGAEVLFKLENAALGDLKIFTTRPDTLFGCTYMVLAPEHPLVPGLTTDAQRETVEAYRKKTAAKSDVERMSDASKEKSGVFTGSYAINPVNGAKVPVWIADYVLMGYGTGAIMAVPAHDERDYEFAQQYHLPIPRVIAAADGSDQLPYTGDGKLINSPGYDGLDWADAKKKISADLAAKGIGKATINYKLRDWLFSRQRYWGEPFPIVWVSEADYRKAAIVRKDLPASPVTFLENGVTQYALPLPETSLPLTLPETQSYLPSGTGESPLANVSEWLEIWFNVQTGASVPASQAQPAGDEWVRGRRETNTMPQWAGSCWYYLRYLDPQNAGALASPEALKYWGVPDLYVGGAEHAVLHLLYARFWHKVLFDLGVVPQAEPFKKLFHQGIILGEDGVKMSKSRGNVVNPDDIIREYGADTLRLYLMFLGPLEAMKPWNPKGIEGVHRFLKKVWRECLDAVGAVNPRIAAGATLTAETEKLLHETIKKVGEDFDGLRFNTAISQLMILVNAFQKEPALPRQSVLDLLRLVAPLAPHLAEELWARLGETGSVMASGWPAFDAAKLVASTITIVIQVNGKHRGDLSVAPTATEAELTALALQHDKAGPHLTGKAIRRTIYVKGRLINIIV
ncbi:leucine--tRNA ligase [Oleiharenicola lentus]|uniref:Leucine--tRNA ligase n=1 Tax=Oleiharenicola lentus TaxID=2508720 RepID=A0A4Q1C9H6_9BACT|nr:leucine--tRNA ligase [Oleiharenicola lentus]RXK55677.1 leucine--tRNA ligase [Oleiharenicola lentus]